MTTEQIQKLNKDRIKLQLEKIFTNIKPNQQSLFSKYTIYKGDTRVDISKINFKKSVVFICDTDFLGVVGLYGMHQVNNLRLADTTTTAKYSTVRTSYMITNSQEAKYVRLPMEFDYIQNEEQYQSTSYITKDIILWRLFKDAGLGDNNVMYRVCNSLIEEREFNQKVNWIFYIGTSKEFYEQYSVPVDIPVYELRKGGTTKTGINLGNMIK